MLRRRYLPLENESEDSLAAALWLHREHEKQLTNAVTNGIATAFNGS